MGRPGKSVTQDLSCVDTRKDNALARDDGSEARSKAVNSSI